MIHLSKDLFDHKKENLNASISSLFYSFHCSVINSYFDVGNNEEKINLDNLKNDLTLTDPYITINNIDFVKVNNFQRELSSMDIFLNKMNSMFAMKNFFMVYNLINEMHKSVLDKCPLISITLITLEIFKLSESNDFAKVKDFIYHLNTFCLSLDDQYLHKKVEYMNNLIKYNYLFKSNYYTKIKLPCFITSLIKIIKYEISIKANNTLVDFSYESYNELRNLEENLLFGVLQYEKDKKYLNLSFDEFIKDKIEPAKYSVDSLMNILNNSKYKIFHICKIPKVESNDIQRIFYVKASSNKHYKNIIYNNGKSKAININELKLFPFKNVKRENIDKKIIRKFRKFIKQNKKNQFINSELIDEFTKRNIFPPCFFNGWFFKSFNAAYLIKIFSNKELYFLYEEFVSSNIDKVTKFTVESLKITNFSDKLLVSDYIKNIGRIYSQYEKVLSLYEKEVIEQKS